MHALLYIVFYGGLGHQYTRVLMAAVISLFMSNTEPPPPQTMTSRQVYILYVIESAAYGVLFKNSNE